MDNFLPSPYQKVPKHTRMLEVVGGDDCTFTALALNRGVAATPANSRLRVRLADSKFAETSLWEGSWRCGIDPVTDAVAGLVQVQIPHEILDQLHEGGYSISMSMSDVLGQSTRTVAEGTLLLRYTPTSPQREIPYRTSSATPDTILRQTAPQNSRLAYRVLDVPVQALSLALDVPAGYRLASAPVMMAPSADVANIWLTNTVAMPGSVVAYFSAPVAEAGWKVSYVLIEV